MLMELTIALIVLMGIATHDLWSKTRALSEERIEGAADELLTLSNAAGNYQTQFYDKLVAGQAVTGFANALQPTVAELAAAGLLTNFSSTNAYGGGYVIRISTVAVPGPPAGTDLKALTCLNTAIVNTGTGGVDLPLLGTALSRIGGNGGFSKSGTAGTINGSDGAWSEPNPVTASGNAVAGILCIRSGYGASGLLQLTRRDGTLQPTGPWNMNNVNVTGINNLGSTTLNNSGTATIGGVATTSGITNTGAISNTGTLTNSGATTLQSTLSVTGQTTANGIANTGIIANTGSITNTGNLTSNGATTLGSTLTVSGQTNTNGISNTGNISTTGDTRTGRVQLQTTVSNGASCSGLDGYQARTAAGSIASCINGLWSTPSATTQPPSPCNGTSVSFGAGCTGTLPFTTSGQSANVSMTSGTGYATYSCNNGSWGFVSGSCTPPPAGCSAQTVSWSVSASCSGSVSSMSSGSGQWVNSSNGNSGSAFASCNNGSISLSSTTCNATRYSYTWPTTVEGIRISFSPERIAVICQSHGKSPAPIAESTYVDWKKANIPICGNISISNGMLICTPSTGTSNCLNSPWSTQGCYLVSKAVCM